MLLRPQGKRPSQSIPWPSSRTTFVTWRQDVFDPKPSRIPPAPCKNAAKQHNENRMMLVMWDNGEHLDLGLCHAIWNSNNYIGGAAFRLVRLQLYLFELERFPWKAQLVLYNVGTNETYETEPQQSIGLNGGLRWKDMYAVSLCKNDFCSGCARFH